MSRWVASISSCVDLLWWSNVATVEQLAQALTEVLKGVANYPKLVKAKGLFTTPEEGKMGGVVYYSK